MIESGAKVAQLRHLALKGYLAQLSQKRCQIEVRYADCG